MANTKEELHSSVHERSMREFNDVQCASRDVRLQCLQDRRFYSIPGAQWEGDLEEQFANKPRFEFNKTHLAVIRIFNEYRNNRITADFIPKDGNPDDKLAETCNGLYRADEKASTADEAYDNAFEEGVGGGFGAWRLRACYENEEDDDDERQRVRFEPIFDADSCVFYDLGAKRQDKSDAKRCWVLNPMPIEQYREEYNDDPTSWPKLITQSYFDWDTPDVVYVAEYYEVEEKSEVVHVFRGLDDIDMDVHARELKDDPNKLTELTATGFREVRQKRRKVRKVHKYIMSGGGILEDEGYIAGKYIPIIPFYAKRWVVDNIERCQGHVRLALDAQRLVNMLLSWLAEIASRFDMEKPILTPEQIAGHATMWAQDNVERFPYLLINQTTDLDGNPTAIGPQAYTHAPNVPPAMAALLQIAEQALNDLLGNQQVGEEVRPNLSGKALEMIQTRLDMQVFIYMSNLAKSVKWCAQVWLSIEQDIAIEENRRMKTIDKRGEVGSVVLNQPMYDEEKAEQYTANDLSKADMEVDCDVGPSSSSRRAKTVRELTALMGMTTDPETQMVLSSMAMMNMEGEGLDEVREFFRKRLINAGAVKPNEEEAQQLEEQAQAKAQQPPDPQTQYLLAAAEEAQASAAKDRAGTVQTIADADLKAAQAEKTRAETSGEHHSQQIATVQTLQSILKPDTSTK